MATPPNKRDAQRAARLAGIKQAQAARRTPGDDAAAPPAEIIAAPAPVVEVTDSAASESVATGAARPAPATSPAKPATSGKVNPPRTGTTVSRPLAGPARPATAGVRSATPSRPVASAPKPTFAAKDASAEDVIVAPTKRDSHREERRQDIARVRQERRQAIQAAKRREFLGRLAAVAAALIVICLIGFFIYSAGAGTSTATTFGAINGVTCDTVAHDNQVHYHANMQIYINGKNYPVPQDVGIPNNGQTCLYWLHTHDATGTIHIEAPSSKGPFMLGTFFGIWSKTNPPSSLPGAPQLTTSSFFGMPVDAQHTLTVYIDGVKYTGDPTKIQLKSQENIWLEYGQPQVTPTPFNFTANNVNP